MVINGPYCGANRRLFYISWVIPLILIIILVIYSVKEILGFNNSGADHPNQLIRKACEQQGRFCDRTEYCCEGSNGPTCCPENPNSEEINRRSGVGWHRSLGFWNMWYFWLAIVLMLAFCFTGCSYWRRRRQLAQLQQLAGWTSTESTCPHPSDPSLMVPFTMYEVPPEALLRFMQENSHRAAAAAQIPPETLPPSYNEVALEPEKYPVPKSEVTTDSNECPPPPAYESIPSEILHSSSQGNVTGVTAENITPTPTTTATEPQQQPVATVAISISETTTGNTTAPTLESSSKTVTSSTA